MKEIRKIQIQKILLSWCEEFTDISNNECYIQMHKDKDISKLELEKLINN